MLWGVGESSLNSIDNLVHHFTSSWVAKDIYYSYNLAHELKPTPSSGAQLLKLWFQCWRKL